MLTSFQWPYSYDSCDVGTLPNQTYPGERRPIGATINGDPEVGGELVSEDGSLNPCFASLISFNSRTFQDNGYVSFNGLLFVKVF